LGRVYIKQTAVKEVSGFCNIQWCSVCMDVCIPITGCLAASPCLFPQSPLPRSVICGRFFPVFWPVSSLIAVFDQAVYAILHALCEQAFSWRYGDGEGTVKKKERNWTTSSRLTIHLWHPVACFASCFALLSCAPPWWSFASSRSANSVQSARTARSYPFFLSR
jgi:hypothetical protein